jgi:hypothetical protein
LSGQVSASLSDFKLSQRKKQRGQCLTLTALKALPCRAFIAPLPGIAAPTGLRRAYRDTSRLAGPRKYYYGLLATKFQTMRGKRTASPELAQNIVGAVQIECCVKRVLLGVQNRL